MVDLFIKMSVLVFLLTYHSFVFADEESFFTDHEKGWHWYDDPKNVDEETDPALDGDPITQMNAVRTTVQRALDAAVITPTKKNVKYFIGLQNQLSNHANQFNHSWQAVLLEDPELNFSLKHPTNNLAKQVEYEKQHQSEEKMVRQFAQNYQIYFFYRSTCPYCQRFSPVLKDFAANYGFNVLPITMDGVSLPEFPGSYIDDGISQIYNVTVEPTVFAVSPVTHKGVRIGTGVMSQSEIKNNIVARITHFDGDVR